MTERGRVSYSHSNDPESNERPERGDGSARQGRRRRSSPGAAPREVPLSQPSQTGDAGWSSPQAQPPGRPPQGPGPDPRSGPVSPPSGAPRPNAMPYPGGTRQPGGMPQPGPMSPP